MSSRPAPRITIGRFDTPVFYLLIRREPRKPACILDRTAGKAVERITVKTTIAAALVALAVGAAVPASAQTAQQGTTNDPATVTSTAPTTPQGPAPTPPQSPLTVHDWLKRPQLLGDWGGARTNMADNGFTLGAAWTQFFQWAPMRSPNGDERDYLYGGKLDFRAMGDFGKMNDRLKG